MIYFPVTIAKSLFLKLKKALQRRAKIDMKTYRNNGAKTSATMLISLMRIFKEGPAVSLNGSPIVSPITAAL